jgi:hypothetical protein
MKKLLIIFAFSFVAFALQTTNSVAAPSVQSWQTTNFTSPMTNYKPPASVFGYTSWTPSNDFYSLTYDFNVTGISNGVGFQ